MGLLEDIINRGQQQYQNMGQAQQVTPQQIMPQIGQPQTKEEQAVRAKTKAIGSLTGDFAKSLEGVPDETKPTLIQAFMKNLLKPPETEKTPEKSSEKPQTPSVIPSSTPKTSDDKDTDDKDNFLMQLLLSAGVPGLAAIIGSTTGNQNVLAGASGLSQGYAGGYTGAQELGEKRVERAEKKTEKEEKEEKEKRDDSYSIAIQLSKMGVVDKELTPQQLSALAEEVYAIKHGEYVDKNIDTAKGKSPYKQWPDAFQEDGVWKVMVDGKKYRIED